MIDEKSFLDHPVKSNLRTYFSIRKIATGEGDDYTTGCLLDYLFFFFNLNFFLLFHYPLIYKNIGKFTI